MKIVLIGLVFILLSCDKAGSNIIALEGNYIGCFHRTNDKASQIRINFANNSYAGKSSEKLYPLLGKDTFKQKESSIIFNDSCSWSPGFDQAPALKGTYNYKYYDDGTVRIWRTFVNGIDEYILRKSEAVLNRE